VNDISEAIKHTPVWVFPLIVLVLWLGARNLQNRERPIAALYVLPLILLILAVVNLASSRANLILVIPAFVASLAIGAAIGWNLVPRNTTAIQGQGRIRVPGSVVPLLMVIAAIILRYAIGYIYGRWPELRTDPTLALEFSATSALLAGVVWGRILRLGWIYRRGG
jgi:prepilin signal peptidase PulO-like enzyme (type II secretory pathway)